MLRKFQWEPLKPDQVLAFYQASFHMTLSQAGFLMLAPDTGFPHHRQILIFWGVDAQEIPGGTPEA